MVTEARLEAQGAVLGSILIDARCLPAVLKIVHAGDFTEPHRLIFDAAADLYARKGNETIIDPVTIAANISHEQFPDRDRLRQFMVELMEITPTAANAERYAQIVRDESRKAQIHAACGEMLNCHELPQLRRILYQTSEAVADRRSSVTTTMAEALTGFYNRCDDGRAWLPWPFPNLRDKLFARLGDYIVLGAESSVGKTAMALQLATYWASKGYKVGFFSLETDDEDVSDRMLAGFLGLDMQTILRNQMTDAQYAALAHISGQIAAMPLVIVNANGMTVSDITTRALIEGFDIILIDYLQLIVPEKANTREQEVSRTSTALKNFGRSNKVTVVALSQFNRSSNSEEGAPTLDRLRDSSQVRNDGDIIFLMSLKKPDAKDGDIDFGVRRFHVAKNKRGPRAHVHLAFDAPRQLFYPANEKGPKPLFRLPSVEQMTFDT